MTDPTSKLLQLLRDRCNELRAEANARGQTLSWDDIAARTGVSRVTLHRWQTEAVTGDAQTLERALLALGVTVTGSKIGEVP